MKKNGVVETINKNWNMRIPIETDLARLYNAYDTYFDVLNFIYNSYSCLNKNDAILIIENEMANIDANNLKEQSDFNRFSKRRLSSIKSFIENYCIDGMVIAP